MKILMICELYDPDLEFQENQLAKYYRKLGHEVMVLTSTFSDVFDYYSARHDPKRPGWTETDHGATIHHLPYRYNIKNRIRAYRDITPYLEDFAPDLLYAHDIQPNFPQMVAYMKRNPGARMIMDYHADYSNSGRNWVSLKILHGVIRKYFLDRARPYLSSIMPIVPAGFTFLHEIYKVPMDEMELLPLGGDVDLIDEVASSAPPEKTRKSYGLKGDEFVIFTGGKLARRKQIELLFEAIDCSELGDAHILIAGQFPPDDDEYKTSVMSRFDGLKDRLHFAGWQKPRGVYELMGASDVAVFPASQSVMWQQSICSGLPLIVGDTGGQDISYMNEFGAIHSLSKDELTAEKLREAIVRLKNDSDHYKRTVQAARRTRDELLDWNLLVERTLRFNVKDG